MVRLLVMWYELAAPVEHHAGHEEAGEASERQDLGKRSANERRS